MSGEFEIDVSELEHLAVDVAKMPGKVQQRAGQIVRKTAADIEATGRALCPVDTGFLRNTIHVTMQGPTEAIVGPETPYAGFVEYGTASRAPQAFMGPAADRHGHEFVAAFENIADGLL